MGIFGGNKLKGIETAIKNFLSTMGKRTGVSRVNGNTAIYPNYSLKDYANRYVTTDDIYSIVRMLAQTAAMIPIYSYEVKNEEAAKRLKAIQKPCEIPLQAKALQIKALNELPESDPLQMLMNDPCMDSSRYEFYIAAYTYLYLFGECFIYKHVSEITGKPFAMYIMHPENVILKVSHGYPRTVVGYDYIIDGVKVEENIPLELVMHIKEFNPETCNYNGDNLRGLSRIRVLAKRLTQHDSNLDVQTAQMQNGGVEVIVYDKGDGVAIGTDGKEISVAGKRSSDFYKHIKETTNAGLPYFANGEMGAINIGSTLADLKVIESAGVTFAKMCNVFGTSHLLFNVVQGTTFDNLDAVIARSYTNSTLPMVYLLRDGLKRGLMPMFKGKKYELREDISEISELQPKTKEMVEWLNISWWVTPNEKRAMLKFERYDDPLFDKPMIPSGLSPIDDFKVIEPL